jgi:hypothetical protein
METREGLLVAVWTEKVPPQKEIGPCGRKKSNIGAGLCSKINEDGEFCADFFPSGGSLSAFLHHHHRHADASNGGGRLRCNCLRLTGAEARSALLDG